MKDMFKMLRDTTAMKRQVKKIQDGLRKKTVEFSSKDGKITVTARGDGSIADIKIDPGVIDPSDPARLEKMVLNAVGGAIEAARKMSSHDMSQMATELGLPKIPGL